MKRKQLVNRATDELLKLVQKMSRLEKKAVDLGTGDQLTQVEIHTIDAIGKNRAKTVSELCNLFAVTKGAVSQVVGRLTAKGYVSKQTNAAYVKEKLLELTDSGKKAFQAHQKLHDRMDEDLLDELGDLAESEIDHFLDMLKKVGRHVDRFLDLK